MLVCRNKILTGSFDKTSKVWDADTGELCYTLLGHSAEIVSALLQVVFKTYINVVWQVSAQFSPSCNWIATGCMDGLVKVWDTEAGKCLGTLTVSAGLTIYYPG